MPSLFEGWNSVTGGLSDFLAVVLLLALAASAFGELWYFTNFLNRLGSVRQNLIRLAIFSVTTPLLIALGFVAMLAPNVHTAGDFVGFWLLAAIWIVPASLLSEIVILYLLRRERRNTVQMQI